MRSVALVKLVEIDRLID